MDDGYVDFGTYHPQEAQRLLDVFVANSIRFDIALAERPLDLNQGTRAYNLTIDPTVSIAVHDEDLEWAMQVRADVFKVQV